MDVTRNLYNLYLLAKLMLDVSVYNCETGLKERLMLVSITARAVLEMIHVCVNKCETGVGKTTV